MRDRGGSKIRTEPKMVHDGDLPGVGKFDDGVDVEIELGRLVVLWEHGVPEDGQRAQRGVGEHDVAAQVVPGASAAEGSEPPDARRLRIHRPTERERIDQQSSSSALNTEPGSIASRQADSAGHTRGAGCIALRLTRWL